MNAEQQFKKAFAENNPEQLRELLQDSLKRHAVWDIVEKDRRPLWLNLVANRKRFKKLYPVFREFKLRLPQESGMVYRAGMISTLELAVHHKNWDLVKDLINMNYPTGVLSKKWGSLDYLMCMTTDFSKGYLTSHSAIKDIQVLNNVHEKIDLIRFMIHKKKEISSLTLGNLVATAMLIKRKGGQEEALLSLNKIIEKQLKNKVPVILSRRYFELMKTLYARHQLPWLFKDEEFIQKTLPLVWLYQLKIGNPQPALMHWVQDKMPLKNLHESDFDDKIKEWLGICAWFSPAFSSTLEKRTELFKSDDELFTYLGENKHAFKNAYLFEIQVLSRIREKEPVNNELERQSWERLKQLHRVADRATMNYKGRGVVWEDHEKFPGIENRHKTGFVYLLNIEEPKGMLHKILSRMIRKEPQEFFEFLIQQGFIEKARQLYGPGLEKTLKHLENLETFKFSRRQFEAEVKPLFVQYELNESLLPAQKRPSPPLFSPRF